MSELLIAGQLPRLGTKGPLVYGALAQKAGVRELLTTRLLARLADLNLDEAEPPEQGPVVLKRDPLGRPVLYLGEKPGPAISFSEAGGWLWGALCAKGEVGLDVALSQDFFPPYPYSRVFRPGEWEWALSHLEGRTPLAAALLWAAKEAAAKALGVGFHRWPPLTFEVFPGVIGTGGFFLTVRVQNTSIAAWVCPLDEGWLVLAVT